MATKLKKMKLTSVDLVRAGANQEASIELFKSEVPVEKDAQSFREITDARKEQEKLWTYNDALTQAIRSIQEDRDLDEETRQDLLQETWEQYCAAMAEVLGFAFEEESEISDSSEQVMVEKEPEPDLEEIEEVGKSAFTSKPGCDIIEEIQKFNPFHDSLGRFASSNSFRTYSANPKSKAGAMAIDRSAQAGYTQTLNVHDESKGENIGQNYDWLHHTKQPPFNAYNLLTGYTGEPKKQKTPSKPKQQESEKPKQQESEKPEQPKTDLDMETKKPKGNSSIEAAVKDVSLSDSQKLALSARDNSGQICDTKAIVKDYDGARVEGRDISKSFDYQMTETALGLNGPLYGAIDEVAKAQGWDKAPPTVISDRDTFDKLCLENGCVIMRSVHDNYHTGASAEQVAIDTMSRSDVSLGGSDHKAYGGGMYAVNTEISSSSSANTLAHNVASGQDASYVYGPVQMMATFRPGARIADQKTAKALTSQFNHLPASEQARFGGDFGAYIASKGYDGAKWEYGPDAYYTHYNKSALVFFNEVAGA